MQSWNWKSFSEEWNPWTWEVRPVLKPLTRWYFESFLTTKMKKITSLCIKKCSVVAENVRQVPAMTTFRYHSSKLSTSSWKDRICSGWHMKKPKCWNLAIPEYRDWTHSPSQIYNVIKTKILVNILIINSQTNYLYFEPRCKNYYVKLLMESARHSLRDLWYIVRYVYK